MISETTVIEIVAVNESDGHLRITTRRDIRTLAASIRHLGLINPPILRKSNAGYTVVCGFRRVEACRRIGMKSIPARLSGEDVSDLECVELAIADNAMQRDLNELELSRCFCLLSRFYPQMSLLTEAAGRLGLPAGMPYVKKLLTLASLPGKIQTAVACGQISLSMVERLRQCDAADADAMASLFMALRPSLNKQQEIFRLCREISKREEISITALLNNPELKALTASEDLDSNRRTTLLRQALQKRRMPALNKALQRFQRELDGLKLGRGGTLVPPAGFEGRKYRLVFEFSTPHDLERHLATLKQLVDNPALERILDRRNITGE
jgi:ParB/RepB/Spo0J family partition protein